VATWTLDVYNRTGTTLVQADLPFRSVSARFELNGPGSLEADFSLYASGITAAEVGKHELQLKRNGTVWWAGPLRQVDVDADARTVRFQARGLLAWLEDRVVTSDLYYNAVNQETIAWNLIDHTQSQANGALGIVQGSHTGASNARTRAYCGIYERPNVMEELLKFTELENGLDFDINPANRHFRTWRGRRGSASGITLSGANLDTLRYVQSAEEMVTYADAIGEGDCKPNVQSASAPAGTLTDYGRRHVAVDVDHTITADIAEEANELVYNGKRPRLDAEVTFRIGGTGAPGWAAWDIGDTLTLTDNRGYSNFSQTVRIVDYGIALDRGLPGVEMVEMSLSSAVGA
jgi:hypothetical protein